MEPREPSSPKHRQLVTNEELWEKIDSLHQTILETQRPALPRWAGVIFALMALAHLGELASLVHLMKAPPIVLEDRAR